MNADKCPAHPPDEVAPPATVVFGARKYCKNCRDFLAAPVVDEEAANG